METATMTAPKNVKKPAPLRTFCRMTSTRAAKAPATAEHATPWSSPALALVLHVWNHNREATAHSWQRLNQSMASALMLAIDAGLEFDAGDFKYISEKLRFGRWAGTDSSTMSGERFYSAAVRTGNTSACQSFEEWKERGPFFWKGQRIGLNSEVDAFNGSSGGAEGYRGKVTSFSADGKQIIVTTYKWNDDMQNLNRCKVHKIQIETLRILEKVRKLSAKSPEKIFCANCCEIVEKPGKCPACGGTRGVRNEKFGSLGNAT